MMKDEELFEFDLDDDELELAQQRAAQKAREVAEDFGDEADCDGCKI